MKEIRTNNHHLLVYVTQVNARNSYIITELFPYAEITESREIFSAHLGVKITYSADKFCNNTLWIVPHGLLSQDGIHEQTITCSEWKNETSFFTTGGDVPFDIFAASFYLITRYEEYLPHEKDQYGRYAHTNSTAYKNDFLKIPLINEWLQLLEIELRERCSNLKFRISDSKFRFIPTYDIDEAYSYLHKPLLRNIFGFFRDLLQSRFEKVVERGNVYSGRKKDPYDSFEWIDSLHETYHLQPIYFFLTIIKRGEYDKNLPASASILQQLYKEIAAKYATGLHPSWQSGTEENLLGEEKLLLENIIERKIDRSRNHYLRFSIPHTYRRLINAGITDDYSMAYGNVNGFRASYAMPFHWYDLENEKPTNLVVHPFCFMEATSVFNQGYTVQEAAEEIQYYHDTVKKINGEFITLFHNHFLTEQPEWNPWRHMYSAFLQKNFNAGDRKGVR